MGFSTHFAHELFVELDEDNSGSVELAELTKTIREHVGKLSDDTKKFITTLAFSEAQVWNQSQSVEVTGHQHVKGISYEDFEKLDKTKVELKGPDSDSLLKQIQDLLANNNLKDSDLYNLLVAPLVKGEPTQTLTKEVFAVGINRLGYIGPQGMLYTLYKKMDTE